jgi:hypothetical protein
MFGCHSYHELCRVRGWDKNLPGSILGALPKRKWLKRLQRLGQELLTQLWQHVDAKSPATRSRWPWTWVGEVVGEERYYLLCRETALSAPRLIRAWKRRRWIEHSFRTLKHLLATVILS